MNDTDDGGDRSLKVAQRVFEILEFLSGGEEVGVTELADHLGVPKTTAHSYLKTLENCGYAINKEGTYRVSLKFLEHAGRVRNQMSVYQSAKSEVERLARETEEAINLGVEERGKRVILYSSEGENAVWDDSPIGDRTYMHLTAMGKAMLAYLPEAEVEEIVDRHGLPAATRNSITDAEALSRDLVETRERGYAIEDEEHQVGICAVSVPIKRNDGTVIGALSVVGPKSRLMTGQTQDELVDRLMETVNVVELQYEHY